MNAPVEAPDSSLPEHMSARQLLSRGQRVTAVAALGVVLGSTLLWWAAGSSSAALFWARVWVIAMSATYLLVIGFRSLMVRLGSGVVDPISDGASTASADDLPGYTALVPLHREAAMLPNLVEHLGALRYPADKLRVLLLVEEDDRITQDALAPLELPLHFEVVVVPPGGPRTKPNACNAGLARTSSELCVVFDAEDRPDPEQLREAAAAFREHPPDVVCLQAELDYWNPWTNWLTRMFAGEYALNFALVLRGLEQLRLPIPLGGTSNHLRVSALRELGGWDPHNVTEDADLGVRIARRGWGVRMLTSVTWEEANSKLDNWIRQRSRWIKGHVQTWLVHMRRPRRLLAELGLREFVAFQLTFAFNNLVVLCNPVFWGLFCWYLVYGPNSVAALYPPPVLYAGTAAMLVGNLITIYLFMIACMARPGLHRAVPVMVTVPLYWALMSVAALRAVAQLVRPSRRHYWELTVHGLVAEREPDTASP